MGKEEYFIRGGEFFVKTEDDKVYCIPAQALHRYWREPCKDNKIEDYLRTDGRSDKLLEIFNKYCDKKDSIFEIGCNVGRNINHLYEAGFENISGLDINKDAIQTGVVAYPNSMGRLNIICSPIEDYLANNEDISFDVVFSMAVFMHIHPSSQWIFPRLSSVAKKYIITAEEEGGLNLRVFPRDYKRMFENFGMTQIHEEYCEFPNHIDDTGTIRLMYRVFKK